MGEDMGLGAPSDKGIEKHRGQPLKLLCTGSSGMLGEGIRKIFDGEDLMLTDKYELDVRNYDNVMSVIDRLPFTPEYILHMAAETDLEVCELWPEHAYMTNTIGTANIVKLAEVLDVPIIYISTAGVFDGRFKRAYTVTDKPNPINHYGRSKYYGEQAVINYGRYYIFRLSWAIGGGPKLDKKFVNKVYKQIEAGKKVLHSISDVYGTPTYTHDVAKAILQALKTEQPYGVYHTSGEGSASRYDVTKVIVEILNKDVEVKPVSANFYNKTFFCPRAQNETMVNNLPMRPWREALEEYLRGYYL